MQSTNADLSVTEESWKKIKTLRAVPIDLSRVDLIREMDAASLTDARAVERLICELGLNDEGLEEYPPALHPYCGQGLRIWQQPAQMAPYLVDLAGLGVRSYLEVGIRHGGTFVATVEYLERFRPLRFAVGVDLFPCPSFAEYQRLNPRAKFARVNTQTDAYRELVAECGEIDLVLIDAFHEEAQLRSEFESVRNHARIVAIHDIVNTAFPGVRRVWDDVKASGEWECREYVAQHPEMPEPCMGMGLAIRRDAA